MIVSRAAESRPLISKHFVLVLQNPPRRVDGDWPADRRDCLQADSDEPTPHDRAFSERPRPAAAGPRPRPRTDRDGGSGPGLVVKAAQLSVTGPVLLGRRVAAVLACRAHYSSHCIGHE